MIPVNYQPPVLVCIRCTEKGVAITRPFITARKRSLRRLCFYRCLSVHRGGVRGCSQGGMHGCSGGRRVCMVALGGMCGCSGGVCMVALGCVCGCSGGHVWLLLGGGHAWDMTRYGDTINEWAVRILLECILVLGNDCCLARVSFLVELFQVWM